MCRGRKTHGEKGEGRNMEEKRKKERGKERGEEGEIERKRGRGRGEREAEGPLMVEGAPHPSDVSSLAISR